MFEFNENYHYRKCFFEREPQVPTQTLMKKKMGEHLAQVYFKSMTPKLKVLAGLEPRLKGGGSDWYQSPYDILQGKPVLKPIKKEHLGKLSYLGIDGFSLKLAEDHQTRMELYKQKKISDSNERWKDFIVLRCMEYWEDKSKAAAEKNTERIQRAFREFTSVYSTSITKVETVLFEAAENEIRRVRKQAFDKMQEHYEDLLEKQAIMLTDRFEQRLMKRKEELKKEFIKNVEESHKSVVHQLHNINVEKRTAIEKLRHLLECQTLACQVYVALKEREECEKELELSKHEHKKKVKVLKETIMIKDLEISLAIEKEKKRRAFNRIWQKKVCEVVKKFQIFVSYSLNVLPEYADFFFNMEKLMMLQLEEAVENPSVESLFVPDPPKYNTPIPQPHPFFLFCDKGYKPEIDPKLCPPHYTASAEQLPVIVINKRCIYAACDNFEQFTNKITDFIHGRRGDDKDFEDHHRYDLDVPVKYTSSIQLEELKLESSLMQVLQKERPNIKNLPVDCCVCKLPHCFCTPMHASKLPSPEPTPPATKRSLRSVPSGHKIETRSMELQLEREPKWESYMDYVKSKKCECAKTAKKHLMEHLPPYMKNMSSFDAPELPNYERCSLETLKRLVRKAQRKVPPPPPPEKVPSKTKDAFTQASDTEFDMLCTCFSADELEKLLKEIMKEPKPCSTHERRNQFKFVDGSMSDTHLGKQSSSFATDRAYSLRNLLDDSPQLEDIFRRDNCSFMSFNSH